VLLLALIAVCVCGVIRAVLEREEVLSLDLQSPAVGNETYIVSAWSQLKWQSNTD